MTVDTEKADPNATRQGSALAAALGIFSSKVIGQFREIAIATFFGVGPHADVWRTALRAPNVLQNLLGEQTLSAAFIPIYSSLIHQGRREEAGRFAGAILGLLLATATLIVVIGMAFAPQIVGVLAAGFLRDANAVAAGTASVDRFPLLVEAVRIVFPMTGLLVLSAWALGILNSHRRFYLPYAAPIIWNLAILVALLGAAWKSGGLGDPAAVTAQTLETWLFAACWGALVGAALQLAIQLPTIHRLLPELRLSFSLNAPRVREALGALGPALAGRGVVQLSLYVDTFLATFLAAGATAAIGFATTLLNVPLGVFGMSVAAAELPELARRDPLQAGHEIAGRIIRGLRQSSFVVLPSMIGLTALGWLVVGLIYRYGSFGVAEQWLVYLVLVAYSLGLLASTWSRLLQNSFFALRDTRTPARIALLRLFLSATTGIVLMMWLDSFRLVDFKAGLAEHLRLGALALGLASSLGAWFEALALIHALRRRLPELKWPFARLTKLFLLALVPLPIVCGLWHLLRDSAFGLVAAPVLGLYALIYLGAAWFGKVEELSFWLEHPRLRRFLR